MACTGRALWLAMEEVFATSNLLVVDSAAILERVVTATSSELWSFIWVDSERPATLDSDTSEVEAQTRCTPRAHLRVLLTLRMPAAS